MQCETSYCSRVAVFHCCCLSLQLLSAPSLTTCIQHVSPISIARLSYCLRSVGTHLPKQQNGSPSDSNTSEAPHMSPSTGCCWRTDPSCLPCGSHVGHSCSARHCCGATHRLTLQLQPNAAGWSLSYCLSVTLTFRLQQVATASWLTLQAAAMWQPTAARPILIISALTKLEAPKETARQSYPSSTPPHMLHHYVQQKPKTSKCAAPHPANMCIRLGASFQPIAVEAPDAWLQLTVASAVMEGCGAPP